MHVTGFMIRSVWSGERNSGPEHYELQYSDNGADWKVAYKEDSPDARFKVTVQTTRTDVYFDVFDITAQYWRIYKTIDISPANTETMGIRNIMFMKR